MKRLVVGISGAPGAIYCIRFLEVLSRSNVETHLVITDAAKKTIQMETDWKVEKVESLAKVVHNNKNLGASISSGSFQTWGMVVIPCSIKSLSAIANSFNQNLLIRAAHVTSKEARKLVLIVRETPLHKGHLNMMMSLAERGQSSSPPSLLSTIIRKQSMILSITPQGRSLTCLGLITISSRGGEALIQERI